MKKMLVAISFILSSCATVAPLDVNNFENIAELSNEMAKSYTPGVMKLTTYAGMNTSIYETSEFTSATFKIKGEVDELKKVEQTYKAYCNKLQGNFQEKNSAIFPAMKFMFCSNQSNASALFSVLIDATPYDSSNTLQCYSILAVENKAMESKMFADQALKLDQANINRNFYSNSGC